MIGNVFTAIFFHLFSYVIIINFAIIFFLDSPALKENRVVTTQCLSGTGSLRVGAEFLATHNKEVNCSLLSFPNGH